MAAISMPFGAFADRRPPTSGELSAGFPCGELDQELFNWLHWRETVSTPWWPVLSVTTAAPPGSPGASDRYVIPSGSTGDWAGHDGKIAEWTGTNWAIIDPPNGHGVSLPDGRVFERVSGVYVEKLALDSQAGKWAYAVAGGTADALTATLAPVPVAASAGMTIRLLIAAANTGAATLNLNGLGALPIQHLDGNALRADDLIADAVMEMVCTGTAWLLSGLARSQAIAPLFADLTVYVRADGDDANDGLADTAGSAFRTAQGAFNAVVRRYFPSGRTININITTAGEFGPFNIVGAGYIVSLLGVAGAKLVQPAGSGVVVRVTGASRLAISTVELQGGSTQMEAVYGGNIQFGVITFGDAGAFVVNADFGGSLQQAGGCTIASAGGGTAQCAIGCGSGDVQMIGGGWLVTGNPSYSIAFAWVVKGRIYASGASLSGTVTGRRYRAEQLGVIMTAGGGANVFPGNSAGDTPNGGLYI